MIETGIVTKVEKNLASISMVRGEQCHGCTVCKTFGDGSIELIAINKAGARPGDRVEVEIDPGQVVKHSAIVFLLPVVSLMIGYFLGTSYLPRIGLSTEAAGIIGSLGLMILSFGVIVIFDRRARRSQQTNARINRVL